MLEVSNLIAQRSGTFSLSIQSLRVPKQTILCVAGPNGSGKTTFIECLAGLLAPTAGTVTMAGQPVGKDLKTTRAIMGFIPDDEAWFVAGLCAGEYIELLSGIYAEAGVRGNMMARVHELAQALHFTAFTQPLESLSHGNKKKVQIIAGLMHRPKVLIIDELRNGLDPIAIIAAERLIREQAKHGTAIVAATHDLWWAERIAHDILLLVDGTPAVHETTQRITKQFGSVEKLFMRTVGMDATNAVV